MMDFIWKELSIWDRIIFIDNCNKTTLSFWTIVSWWEKRITVLPDDSQCTQFKWNTQIIKI